MMINRLLVVITSLYCAVGVRLVFMHKVMSLLFDDFLPNAGRGQFSFSNERKENGRTVNENIYFCK